MIIQVLMVPTYANAYGNHLCKCLWCPPMLKLMVPTYASAYGAHQYKCLWCPPMLMLMVSTSANAYTIFLRLAGGGSLCQDWQARLTQAQLLLVLNEDC